MVTYELAQWRSGQVLLPLLMQLKPNKLRYFQQGLRAMTLIQSAL